MTTKDKTAKPAVDPSISISALRVTYPGAFGDERTIPLQMRTPLNNVARAFEGIKAITAILYSNEVERNSQEESEVLSADLVYGLCEALSFLAEHGRDNAHDLGSAIFRNTLPGVE